MMKPVDAHCHIDFEQFDDDREKVISESKKTGVYSQRWKI